MEGKTGLEKVVLSSVFCVFTANVLVLLVGCLVVGLLVLQLIEGGENLTDLTSAPAD